MKGTVYCISFGDWRYVGSTFNLKNRQNDHRSKCFKQSSDKYNYFVYRKLRELGITKEQIVCETLTTVEVPSKKELNEYERNWMKFLGANLNHDIPGRTDREYREDNKEKLKKYFSNYRVNNIEKLNCYEKSEKRKKRRNERNRTRKLCECGETSLPQNLSRHKKSLRHQEYLLNKENEI
jgi:hypothetical protein